MSSSKIRAQGQSQGHVTLAFIHLFNFKKHVLTTRIA